MVGLIVLKGLVRLHIDRIQHSIGTEPTPILAEKTPPSPIAAVGSLHIGSVDNLSKTYIYHSGDELPRSELL